MNQLVNYGKLHVFERGVERHVVLVRIQNPDARRLVVHVPMNISQRTGTEVGTARHNQRDFPVAKLQAVLPHSKMLKQALSRERITLRERRLRRRLWRIAKPGKTRKD